MGKIFNKGLSEEDKKEGLLKRLKNIEDKNKVENKDIKEVTDFVDQTLSYKAEKSINKIKTTQKIVDYRKLKIKCGNNIDYDFSDYKTFKELFRDLYYRTITIDEAEGKQDKFNTVKSLLERYAPRDNKYVEAKNELLNNAKNFYIINNGLKDLEEEIKNMSEKEIEIGNPYNIVKVVKKILEVNEKIKKEKA